MPLRKIPLRSLFQTQSQTWSREEGQLINNSSKPALNQVYFEAHFVSNDDNNKQPNLNFSEFTSFNREQIMQANHMIMLLK